LAGSGAATRMRRGVVFIGGPAGELSGRGMIAGTLILGATAGAGTAQGIKRGSVIVLGSVVPPPGFQYACTYRPPHVPLILSRLVKAWGVPMSDTQIHGLFRRHSGDMAELGKGEFLEWCRS
jgi:formylmethanofuran dehydrogenase subunit C